MKQTDSMNVSPLTTDELLHLLHSTRTADDLVDYTAHLDSQVTFHNFAEYLQHKLHENKLSESDLIRASQIQRNYGYQILSGAKKPGRDKLLALCLAAGMDLPETQRALTLANLGQLYARHQRDSVLIFALNRHLSVLETNELLFELGHAPLE